MNIFFVFLCLNFNVNCGLLLFPFIFYGYSLSYLVMWWLCIHFISNISPFHLYFSSWDLFPDAYYFCYILISIAFILFFFLWVLQSSLPVDRFISQMCSFSNLLHLLIQQVNNPSTKTYARSTLKAEVLEEFGRQWSINCRWSSQILPSHRKHWLDLVFLYKFYVPREHL